jgi:hypothetical protein
MVLGIFILQVFLNVMFVSSSGGQVGKMSYDGGASVKEQFLFGDRD